LKAEEKYYEATETEFDKFCDRYFSNDGEISEYCKEKNIPLEESHLN